MLVLLALVDCCPRIYPSQKYIADSIGVSVRSVERAIAELRKNGLILTSGNQSLHYRFTDIFFESVKLSDDTRQIVGSNTVKMSGKEITKENKKEKVLNFQKYSINGINYKSPEQTKADLKAVNNIKRCSPYDDKETALKWLAELSENELKHQFIMDRVEKVKKIWGL